MQRRIKCILTTICCTIFLLLIILLIMYGVRLGTGDESHSAATLGTCGDGSSISSQGTSSTTSLKVMTFNTFLIQCAPGAICQTEEHREQRIRKVTEWFASRDEDVVLFQEVWSYHDVLRDGMSDAGYCHHVMTMGNAGSGLAVFSKHPIADSDFTDWYDAFGIGDGMAPDVLDYEVYVADKGVLYVQITVVDGEVEKPVHLFNLHTTSDSLGDLHDTRVKQFTKTREFIVSKSIPSDEPVLIGGDFNEDRDCRVRRCEGVGKCEDQAYYDEMLETLSVSAVDTVGNNTFTYDTEANPLLKSLYEGKDCDYYQYVLDYIFYSEDHLVASLNKSNCEILNENTSERSATLSETNVTTSEESTVSETKTLLEGVNLSDHLPVTCTFVFDTAASEATEINGKESEEQAVVASDEQDVSRPETIDDGDGSEEQDAIPEEDAGEASEGQDAAPEENGGIFQTEALDSKQVIRPGYET
mmetsp:Transcript_36306/g.76509  ORF Transcript_36306/g.76509 Transcript_36306/m.76509 type:complete len:472 (-) Transcript_36306:383-1798(-)